MIYDVDPIAKTKVLFLNVNGDGLTITPDGKTLHLADRANDHILGFDTTTKAQV